MIEASVNRFRMDLQRPHRLVDPLDGGERMHQLVPVLLEAGKLRKQSREDEQEQEEAGSGEVHELHRDVHDDSEECSRSGDEREPHVGVAPHRGHLTPGDLGRDVAEERAVSLLGPVAARRLQPSEVLAARVLQARRGAAARLAGPSRGVHRTAQHQEEQSPAGGRQQRRRRGHLHGELDVDQCDSASADQRQQLVSCERRPIRLVGQQVREVRGAAAG
jgi:hypothetical protein